MSDNEGLQEIKDWAQNWNLYCLNTDMYVPLSTALQKAYEVGSEYQKREGEIITERGFSPGYLLDWTKPIILTIVRSDLELVDEESEYQVLPELEDGDGFERPSNAVYDLREGDGWSFQIDDLASDRYTTYAASIMTTERKNPVTIQGTVSYLEIGLSGRLWKPLFAST